MLYFPEKSFLRCKPSYCITVPPFLLLVQWLMFPDTVFIYDFWRAVLCTAIFSMGIWHTYNLERQARRAAHVANMVLQTMQDGLIVVSPKGIIVSANPAAGKIFGFTNLVGVSVANGLAPHFETESGDAITADNGPTRRALRGETPPPMLMHAKRTGKWLLAKSNPLFQDKTNNAVESVIVLCSDVTAEREITLGREKFFGMMAHDLRTPLTSMLLSASVLKNKYKEDDITGRMLDTFTMSINDMARMVEDLLIMVGANASKIALNLETIPVQDLLTDTLLVFQQQLIGRNIQLKIENDGCCHCYVDAGRLKQILSNLINNAIKYTPANGTITVRVYPRSGDCYFEVEDSGSGIPKEKLRSIFEPFVRINEGDSIKGTGLGLTIVKDLLEAHGGWVWAESQEGRGTKFTFVIPGRSPKRLHGQKTL